jgi:hypothetical protein
MAMSPKAAAVNFDRAIGRLHKAIADLDHAKRQHSIKLSHLLKQQLEPEEIEPEVSFWQRIRNLLGG